MSRTRWLAVVCFLVLGFTFSTSLVFAHEGHEHAPVEVAESDSVTTIEAVCAVGPIPVIDGIQLNECVTHTFNVGGVDRTVRVYYTKNAVTATRMVDGNPVVLSHWIDTDAQADQVADWFEDAWRRYFADSGHHLYTNGCGAGDLLRVQMEDGVGWSGIAYWASPGNCVIGIDSPNVRAGGGQWTVYHEAQHYLQYSYDSGCYASWQPNYPTNSEFVEGYADLGADSVDATLDIAGYAGIGYNNLTSMYEKSYGNVFNKYFVEQLGSLGTPSDSFHHMDALYAHYEECDVQDSLYVLDTVVPALGGISLNQLFLNFFAANWAKDWADPAMQPDIIYYDDDTGAYGSPTLTQNVNMGTAAGLANTWPDATPDDYAARYYQITPQAGCPYLEMEVDGAPGALLGINFMAAKTTAATHVLRSAWIGENYVRTFAADGAHNRLVTVVNSFTNNYNYTVNATCVTPTINLLEPRQNPRHVMVGAPATPIAFLARWEVLNGSEGVRGLLESNFTFSSEGDPVTIVPGTFQAVGDEYWAVLLPPVRDAGDAGSFFDLTVTLDGGLNDTEPDSLLYVDPGNSDIGLVFDASGSMDDEDIIGEGKRYVNAQRAGNVIADLLRPGDRILVTDFSGKDNPAGCGLDAGGAGDCDYDGHTRLPRTDVISPTAGVIAATKGAIANVVPLEWTPIGEGLTTAKDLLLGGTPSLNPKHIFLLSDGQENVHPLYADVSTELVDSGVVINTIGFGPEAPGNLLAQIAADTGGIYRPVPTTASGASVASIDAVVPAAQLGLANAYDYFDTVAQSASRVLQQEFSGDGSVCQNNLSTIAVQVDKSSTEVRFVLAAKQPDSPDQGYSRLVEVLPPGADPEKGWVRIRPAVGGTVPVQSWPAHWDVRGDAYNDVVIVPPVSGQAFEGQWKLRSCTVVTIFSASADAVPVNFMMAVSVQSDIRLQGRILGLTANQGVAGDVPTISGVLLDRVGVVNEPGTSMTARVEGPGGNYNLMLYDDGLHGDGGAGDGIFAAPFAHTQYGGGYNVVIKALTPDPANPALNLEREWNGGFWIKGPRPDIKDDPNDQDGDGMYDPWEERCGLDTTKNDSREDKDGDGLTNGQEAELGTSPCDPDTDDGGESDGSEVKNQRDPLNPRDDRVRVLDRWDLRPLNEHILIGWSRPISYTKMLLFITPTPDGISVPFDIGSLVDEGESKPDGDYVLPGVTNGQVYTVSLQGVAKDPDTGEDVFGPMTEPQTVTPKADPDAPSGAVEIENDAPEVYTKTVELNITSTDEPLPGAAQSANAHMTDILSEIYNVAAGNVEMRISNQADMGNDPWEQLTQIKTWKLDCDFGQICRVYAQFRDGEGNESLIISDEVALVAPPRRDLFLPFTNVND